ncbi:hypothetical protein NPIL_457601 [Nephila pilipes]|uniref:Uncharacterized protein n=1 Tax=Nephila pilipes TaxID=299642 RepID=A0A8X6QSZ7_NEPPI|nr:hypothetical protein NPIL_457601 [Nephila pilipes]
MIIAMIFAVFLHILQWAFRAIAGFFDLLYFIEIMIFDSMIEFMDDSVTQLLNRVTSTLETTTDAAFIPFPSVQKTCETLEIKSKLFPPQGYATVTEISYERSDQAPAIPVVQSFFVWKMCKALDLPATLVPEQRDTILSFKQLKVKQPVPIVYSVAVFEICKALDLKAQLASQ